MMMGNMTDSAIAKGDAANPTRSSVALRIAHFVELDFLDAFRCDLANSLDAAIILSPFLSSNRASFYYPVMRALRTRNARVEVYAKPRNEQPAGLQDHFDEVVRRLTNAGSRFNVRPGMHEKVGVIDGQVLWHGSLNILSHNDTRESMLRIESPDLVREVIGDLQLEAASATDVSSVWPIAEGMSFSHDEPTGDERCPSCGAPMSAYENAGLWICTRSPKCNGTKPLEMEKLADRGQAARGEPAIGLPCPVCQAPLSPQGVIDPRFVCVNRDCGFSLDKRLSSWILKALRRSTPK
jgi:hypothetical protein